MASEIRHEFSDTFTERCDLRRQRGGVGFWVPVSFTLRLAELAFVAQPGATEMKAALTLVLGFLFVAGCASTTEKPATSAGSPRTTGPNWEAVDKTVERVRARERAKLQAVETERTVEAGFFPMSDEEYAAALDSARAEIRKANPKMSDGDVESEATKRADEAKRRHEATFTRRASSTYELKRP